MLILASKSPRRAELLRQLQIQFTTLNVDIDETPEVNERSEHYVVRLAKEKALAGVALSTSTNAVLGADTIVVAEQNGQDIILEKPCDFDDAVRMWKLLSGTKHQVMTAVALASDKQVRYKLVVTQVWFKALSFEEMQWYWQTNEPQDKAGGYGIQGLAGQFVTRIEGSYSAVVGLPLYETKQLIDDMGLK